MSLATPPAQTLVSYRREVRRLLHDATQKFWTNTELNDYINDARNRVCASTGCLRRLTTSYLSQGVEQYPVGGVTGAIVTDGGTGWSVVNVAISGDGVGATAVAVLGDPDGSITGGAITGPLEIVAGYGYSGLPTLTFVPSPGTTATGTALLGVVQATFFTFGAGYTVGDELTLSGGTFITPAVVRVLQVGVEYEVVDPGTYTVLPGTPAVIEGLNVTQNIAVTGGTGAGAALTCYWGLSDVTLTNPGTRYNIPPGCNVTGGGGTGAAVSATDVTPLVGGAAVDSITITDPGVGYTTATITFSGDGSLIDTAATAILIPADVMDIMNITPIWGNQRIPMRYMPFTEFNARLRTFFINPQRPAVWSRYGSSRCVAFVQPVPDQLYTTEFDTAIMPSQLVDDTDVDEIRYPYTSPVAYYAAWKAKLKQQAYAEAEAFMKDFNMKILEAQAAIQMRRIPNPYYGYTGA